jgi:hypothetical protein
MIGLSISFGQRHADSFRVRIFVANGTQRNYATLQRMDAKGGTANIARTSGVID